MDNHKVYLADDRHTINHDIQDKENPQRSDSLHPPSRLPSESSLAAHEFTILPLEILFV